MFRRLTCLVHPVSDCVDVQLRVLRKQHGSAAGSGTPGIPERTVLQKRGA